MSLYPDYKEMHDSIQNFIESDAGKAYFENMRKINDIKVSRYKRFEEWLKHNDFEAVMFRLIHEHGDDYQEKCLRTFYNFL